MVQPRWKTNYRTLLTPMDMQRLADPRLNFDFGPPRLEDAIPEPHPVAQILEHKDELMTTAGLTEEEFEVTMVLLLPCTLAPLAFVCHALCKIQPQAVASRQ